MRGTFREGDFLKVVKVEVDELKLGDIIVFNEAEGDKNVVHRIISLKNDKIVTRGDCNRHVDKGFLLNKKLIGKVVGFDRKEKYLIVANGILGYLSSRLIRAKLLCKIVLFSLLKPSYSLIKKTQIVPKIWKPDLQLMTFKSNNGDILKYTHNGKTILVYESNKIRFQRPYDLLFKFEGNSEGTLKIIKLY